MEEGKGSKSSRKMQKADREKLRRDRQNEQFLELGQTLGWKIREISLHFLHLQIFADADRPKNDKATILTDTIQVLNDLTAEIERLNSEYASLSDESKELNQEKNELKEEKATLKSEIDNLNRQYQQRTRVPFPWTTVDPSLIMATPYTYPVPMHAPHPYHHPTMQPFPFFGNQAFVPYSGPSTSSQRTCTSQSSSKRGVKRKQDDDVATDLELKIPGSFPRDTSREEKQLQNEERSVSSSSPTSLCSSSPGEKDSSAAVGSS